MAAPGTPPNPETKQGRKELVTRSVGQLAIHYPQANRGELVLKAKWACEIAQTSDGQGPTVADGGNYLAKAHVKWTGGRREPDKHQKALLVAMCLPGIRSGVHYNGNIMLNGNGIPSFNKHNKNITLTPNGIFTLVGLLITDPARVQFLNDMWDVMSAVHQVFTQMKGAYEDYNMEKSVVRDLRNQGEQAFLTQASAAMGVTKHLANRRTMNIGHKEGYKTMLRGQYAGVALRAAKIIKPEEKPGLINAILSNHGLIVDQCRLSTIAASISLKQTEIQRLPTPEMKKKRVMKIISECHDYFTTQGSFNIPGATANQQTKHMFDRERIVRRRVGN